MKKLIVALTLFVSAAKSQSDIKIAPDIYSHFLAGYAISYTSHHIFQDHKKAQAISMVIGIGAGILKEGYDLSQGRTFSTRDLTMTSLGSILGTVSFQVVLNFKAKKAGDNSAWENIGPGKVGIFD